MGLPQVKRTKRNNNLKNKNKIVLPNSHRLDCCDKLSWIEFLCDKLSWVELVDCVWCELKQLIKPTAYNKWVDWVSANSGHANPSPMSVLDSDLFDGLIDNFTFETHLYTINKYKFRFSYLIVSALLRLETLSSLSSLSLSEGKYD